MNMQDIFDQVATHLLVQNAKALAPDTSNGISTQCLYRAPDGKRCAVGWVLPDEIYDPAMEKNSIGHILSDFPEVRDYLGFENELLLEVLQDMHDHGPVNEWRFRLADIAMSFDLETTAIAAFGT